MTIKNDIIENRKDRRQQIQSCLQVFNHDDDEKLLGNLADVSTQGIKLVSLEQIATGSSFRLEMKLPKDLLEKGRIGFEAKSVWSGWGQEHNTYATGFKTTSISEKNRKILTKLLEKAEEAGGLLND